MATVIMFAAGYVAGAYGGIPAVVALVAGYLFGVANGGAMTVAYLRKQGIL